MQTEFEPEIYHIRGKGDLIKSLKAEAKKADKVLLATDPDREGEAISWHLAFILGLDPTSACRIEFHEITAPLSRTLSSIRAALTWIWLMHSRHAVF